MPRTICDLRSRQKKRTKGALVVKPSHGAVDHDEGAPAVGSPDHRRSVAALFLNVKLSSLVRQQSSG
jgi:hypothetical protein